ncbi:MAG: PKD domain-containing protein [Sulfuricurvum sp.]
MKKYLAGISVLVASVLLVGCGGGDEGSTAATPVSATATDVTVERGKVFDANVTDANGLTAIEQNNSNIYRFSNQPVYPITVKGGWIDVDGDLRKTPTDVELTLELKSYSNIITPLTTYIADANETIRNTKLNALSQKFGLTVDELKTLPSTGSKNALLLQNAIYEHLKLNETNFANINLDTVKTSFDGLGVIASNNPDMNQSELTKLVERGVIKDLIVQGKEKAITLEASDFTSAEKQIYVLSSKDIAVDHTFTNFQPVTNANTSTTYTSEAIVFSGINIPMKISINNSGFKIIKNDIEISGTSTTVENNDKIQLRVISSSSYGTNLSTTLNIDNTFTDILPWGSSSSLCQQNNLSLPSSSEINKYYLSNKTVFDQSTISKFWVTDPHSLVGFGNAYDTKSQTTSGVLLSFNSGVICTKSYPSLTYSVSTKSDPNAAPTARAGNDQKVYIGESVVLNGSLSTDDGTITSYSWTEGSTVLSTSASFSPSNLSAGTHTIGLTVTDNGGKSSIDYVTVTIFSSFTNILPMTATGAKIISSDTINGYTTMTVDAGSQMYFNITNNTNRDFKISKYEITSTYNGISTTRISTTNIAGILGSDSLVANQNVALGYTLSSSVTANSWTATYYLTDVKTGQSFTNMLDGI